MRKLDITLYSTVFILNKTGIKVIVKFCISLVESPDVTCRWRNKHPENWDSQDVLDWLFYTAEKCNLDCSKLRAENFRSTSGADLCNFSIEDFERIESEYGRTLYLLFKDMREGCKCGYK